MKYLSLVAAFVTVAVLAQHAARMPAVAAGGTVSYNASQAVLGAKAYTQNCASCHGANLKGVSAPALVGSSSSIASQSVSEVYTYVSQQMPMTAPGSLSTKEYVDILAYLLQKNGHHPGTHPLTMNVASTGAMKILGK